MVFAFRAVNGRAEKFLLPLRRGVSLTGPCAAVLFQPWRFPRGSQCSRVSA